MNETAVVVKKGKKPANQTYPHTKTLNLMQVETETCNAFLQAVRSLRDTPDGLIPAMADRMDSLEVSIKDGLVTAMINAKLVSGYELITWVVTGSVKKGIHHVMIGALVMLGIHRLNMFEQLTGFDQDDPDNVGLKTMKIVDVARGFYQNDVQKSPDLPPQPELALHIDQASEDVGSSGAYLDLVQVSAHIDLEEQLAKLPDGLDADLHHSTPVEKEVTRITKIISAADLDTTNVLGPEIPRSSADTQSIGEGRSNEVNNYSTARPEDHVIDKNFNSQGRELGNDGNADQFSDADVPAILNAFNRKIPSEAECIRQFHRHSQSQFCAEIQIGRLLLKKKQELKSSALYLKWRRETFADPKFNNSCMSRCTWYGLFEKSLKSKRGLLLEDNDIRLCSQKAMQAIGAYKSINADDLLNEVVNRLDRGEYLSADSVSRLVREFKAKVTKPKQDEEDTTPPIPSTIQELFELPEKWLSRAGKRHVMELQVLLEALEPEINNPAKEAAVVLPLVRIFTVL